MSGSQDLVCVYHTTNTAMAELIRNLLEEEGIQAAVADTNHPFPGLTIAPTEVFVQRASESQARAIIAQAEQSHRNSPTTDDELDDADDASEENGDVLTES